MGSCLHVASDILFELMNWMDGVLHMTHYACIGIKLVCLPFHEYSNDEQTDAFISEISFITQCIYYPLFGDSLLTFPWHCNVT